MTSHPKAQVKLKSPLKWLGSKWSKAQWIINHMPPHVCYCEPFMGSMAVLLTKPPSLLEVANDMNERLVNFFQVLRNHPRELIRRIHYTPFARAEFFACRAALDAAIQHTDPIERARQLYVVVWQSMEKHEGGDTWYIENRITPSRTKVRRRCLDMRQPDNLYAIAKRLHNVQIERGDAFALIPRYDAPTTLFYCDPPYTQDTRTGDKYAHDFTTTDHERLLDLLEGIDGMAMLSGYDNPLYQARLSHWHCIRKASQTRFTTKARDECLWLSPRAYAAMPHEQLSFTFGA
jgi:DNA adenine methylase